MTSDWSVTCAPRSIAKFEVAKSLQAQMPSDHVWSTFVFPASPQFLNQEPPRAQQLSLPDFLVVPHFAHVPLLFTAERLVVAGASVGQRGCQYNTKENCQYFSAIVCMDSFQNVAYDERLEATSWNGTKHTAINDTKFGHSTTYFCKPACLESMYDQTVCRRHLRSSWTKRRRAHNNCVYQFYW